MIVAEQPEAEVACVQAWCQTGSIHEGAWLGSGLTHLLEHSIFNGTERRTSQDIKAQVHRFGGYINAYTTLDRTVFWIDSLAPAIDEAVDLLADVMLNASLLPGPLEREMDVVRRELDMALDDPTRALNRALMAKAYQFHPCRHPVIGYREVFDRLCHSDILNYYRRRFVPNNIFLVIVGDTPAAELFARLRKSWGSAPRSALEALVIPDEPQQLGRREVTERFDTDIGHFSLAWHIPAVSHPDIPPLEVLSAVIGGGVTSRLHRQLRDAEGSVYDIKAHPYLPGFPGLMKITGTCPPANLRAVPHRILECALDWRRHPFTTDELERARLLISTGAVEQLQTVKGLASDLALNWHHARGFDLSHIHFERIQAVTTEDLQRVAEYYLVESGATAALLGNSSAIAIPTPRVRRVARQEGPHRVWIEGRSVVFIPDSRIPMTYCSLVVRGGCIAETAENNGVHRLMTRALLHRTNSRSAQQITDDIARLGGTITANSGYNSARVSVSFASPEVERAIALTFDATMNTTFSKEAILVERETQLAAIRQGWAHPLVLARSILRRAIYTNHPYGMEPNGSEDIVKLLSVNDVAVTHRQCFVESPGVLAICGDFSVDHVSAILQDALQSSYKVRSSEPPPIIQAVERIKERTIAVRASRNQAIVQVGFLACSFSDPDRIAFELLDEVTNHSTSRFFVQIRERLGLAYAVSTSLTVGPVAGTYTIQAAVSSEKAQEAAQLIRSELEQFAKFSGVSSDEFNRAKTRTIAKLAFAKQNQQAYATTVALNELYDIGFDYLHQKRLQIERLTPESIDAVIKKYLKDQPAITVIVSP